MDEIIKLLDPALNYINYKIEEDVMYIYVESNRESFECPHCGKPSTKIHSRYERSFQDLPIQGYKVMIVLTNRKFFCKNLECPNTTFIETYSFIKHKAKKTTRLEDEIVRISTNVSSVAASKNTKKSDCRCWQKHHMQSFKKETQVIDKSSVTKICIDDFALKRREKYGTVMIDIDSHKIIDMIESRELDAVKQWLLSYPNLKVVSRDGSITYKNAISQSHPNALQISDRFHILKNLTNYCKDFLKKHLNSRVAVDEVNEKDLTFTRTHKTYTLKEKYELVVSEISMGKKKSNACKKYHLDIRVYNKIAGFTENERLKYFINKSEIRSNDKAAIKMKLVFEVRESYKKVGSIRQVAILHGLSRNTVKRYLDEKFSSISASKGVKRKSILDPYESLIKSYIQKGVKSSIVEEAIRAKGYSGSSSTVRHYMSNWKKEHCKHSSLTPSIKYEYVDRSKLMKLLFHKVDKVKGLTKTIVEKVFLRNKLFKQIIHLVETFRKLMKSKQVEDLDTWIAKAQALDISEINSFVNGILRDIDAVKNAIVYDYNNGLAEGKVNKIKVTKRIMYGRCGFKLLKEKSLRLEF